MTIDPSGYLSSLRQMELCSRQIEQAIEAEDWDELYRCLGERQRLMDELTAVGDLVLSGFSTEEAAEAEAILKGIQTADQLCTDHLQAKVAEVRGGLADVNRASATVSAYRRSASSRNPQPEARFVDRNQ